MDKVTALLEQLADKVGETAEALWPMAVRYAWADALSLFVFGIVILLTGAITASLLMRYTIKNHGTLDVPPWVFGIVITYFVSIVGLALIISQLAILIEPEGYLIMKALGGSR